MGACACARARARVCVRVCVCVCVCVCQVETIGDAYLAATNLRDDQPAAHAAIMARFSVAAVAAAAATPVDPDNPARGCLRIRVGLHSGPCMAGVCVCMCMCVCACVRTRACSVARVLKFVCLIALRERGVCSRPRACAEGRTEGSAWAG